MRLAAYAVCKFCGRIVYSGQKEARVPSEKNPKYTNIVHADCLDRQSKNDS